MSLPVSFTKDGFVPADKARTRMRLSNGKLLKPLLIGTEGETDTGKTEFALSAPGPGIMICMDRAFDPVFDNPNPPKSRRNDFGFKVIQSPLVNTATQNQFTDYFVAFRKEFYTALANPDAKTVVIDGDSDSWELQKLAEFGKLTQVWPQTRYTDVYAARRAMIARAWDSGKIVIATNKVRDEYVTVYDKDGKPVKEKDGSDRREKSGRKERQGFPDQQYLWQIQLRHLYRPAIQNGNGKVKPQEWGIRILKCKADMSLVGIELWGDDCNFAGLVQSVYPAIPLEEWGF